MDIHIQSHITDFYKRSVINMGTKLYRVLHDLWTLLQQMIS